MKKYLVVGNPVEHSLSPKLHNYWLSSNKIEAIYGKLQAYDDDLKELCSSIKNGQINGLNITVPFKKKIIPYLASDIFLTPIVKAKHGASSGVRGAAHLW